MARPKEFDRDTALMHAIGIFSQHGYEGTSTAALVDAMGIGRQSLYATFGDKWQLYLEAVQRYTADSIGAQLRTLNVGRTSLEGIKSHLDHMVEDAIADPAPSCLGVSAICEFGYSNPELAKLSEHAGHALRTALEHRIAEGKADGSVAADINVREAANFIQAALVGIKVAARGGASAASLRGIARMALRSLG
ncbi:MAG: TetR family transcriptional regulator [Massilia sp.]|jgi:TetR/AcrR family transcriptional repressor of nem operon|nr:TetR family transcriptional regulator [Massilia sp.]